ncbi:hypothetical protein WR25_26332 [Diploscapter pachys]|uniref:Uncharacterized protein n=1 Tax=Diploscapter pachys TaxID=2018661 RepID=A0A2A2L6E7_9BILA|nr:hypothetical protein WR25_26332 [Diploscapter pachys]
MLNRARSRADTLPKQNPIEPILCLSTKSKLLMMFQAARIRPRRMFSRLGLSFSARKTSVASQHLLAEIGLNFAFGIPKFSTPGWANPCSESAYLRSHQSARRALISLRKAST